MLQRLGIPPQFWSMAKHLPGVKELMDHVRQTHPDAKAYVHEMDAKSVHTQTSLPLTHIHQTKHNETFSIGQNRVRVLHTPGHTPGSQCLLLESYSPMRVLTGDTMFIGSYGRIDLEDCSAGDLWNSLNAVLGQLPDDTIVFPAHDYSELKSSTIEQERKTNPGMRFPREQFIQMNSRY